MDISQVISAFSAEGALARNLESFEYRKEQQQMTEAVMDALENDRILMVEAGTGTGKSLAYGLPMAAWALEQGEMVAISTGTINLQQQLVAKDLPLVARVLGKTLEVVLVKGRANYICLRRLYDLTRQMNLIEPGPELAMLPRLLGWADRTKDGSRSDLDKPVSDTLWSMVCAESDACLGRKCPMVSDCFVQRAKEAAGRADVLVVNHHLLLADLSLRMELDEWERSAVLPRFERLVLDEAHGLEDAASAFFGSRISRKGSLGLLGSLFKTGRNAEDRRGVYQNLARAHDRISGHDAPRPLDNTALEVRSAVDHAFDSLVQFSSSLVDGSGNGGRKLRLGRDMMRSREWVAVGEAFRQAAMHLDELSDSIEQMADRVELHSDETGVTAEGRMGAKRLAKLAESFRMLTEMQNGEAGNEVRWVELGSNPSGRFVSIASAPLDLAEKFQEVLFETMRTVVLTSATLTVKGSFEYQAGRLGLDLSDDQRVKRLHLDSPFDFNSCAVLAVPSDAPEPGDSRFESWLPGAIVQLVDASMGGALVLFTSWSLLKKTFEQCSGELESLGFETLCQGKAPRHTLLNRFRRNDSSVLFGTHSFWQGIDVTGDSLRLVIVTKLPFDVPSEPIMQARAELLQNPFMELSLPRAVLKLKQGFGRLIRTVNDKGAVVVLDSRISTKRYGRTFIESLPDVPLLLQSLEDICGSLSGV